MAKLGGELGQAGENRAAVNICINNEGWWDRSSAAKFEADRAQSGYRRITVDTMFDFIERKIFSPSMACGKHHN